MWHSALSLVGHVAASGRLPHTVPQGATAESAVCECVSELSYVIFKSRGVALCPCPCPGETQGVRVAMSIGVVKLVMSQGDVRGMSRGDVKLAMSGRSKLVMSRCVETVSPN